jgi:hypothetical protein
MPRFAIASKALRGPFKKLIRKLELNVRRVVVRVHLKAAERYSDTAAHTEAAFAGARKEAEAVRGARPIPRPRAVSAAVDRLTGKVVGVGRSQETIEIPRKLLAKLPDPSLEPWPSQNCGEVAAAAKAIQEGHRLEDLVIRTVKVGSGQELAPCKNCITWALEGD